MKTFRVPLMLLLVAGLCLLPVSAFAHAVVLPRASTPGAYDRYILRVPNEKKVATTRVEIRFPETARVLSFGEVDGWQLELTRDSAQRITGAVWTGNLPPERFVKFPFIAGNPDNEATLAWPAYQTYADGERVDWIGAPDTERPASTTTITNASGGRRAKFTLLAAIGAFAMSLLSLGFALRKPV